MKQSKKYTIEKLLELGRQNNCIDLAPPLFNSKEVNNKFKKKEKLWKRKH